MDIKISQFWYNFTVIQRLASLIVLAVLGTTNFVLDREVKVTVKLVRMACKQHKTWLHL